MTDSPPAVGASERRCPKCRAVGDILPEPPLPGYLWIRRSQRHCGHMWIIRAPGPASSNRASDSRGGVRRPPIDGGTD